ncbi:MAG: hypothetical protein PWR03_383 [Tenuifilum sp.]|nr:hypothetical protein [Tenuifilum sp.]
MNNGLSTYSGHLYQKDLGHPYRPNQIKITLVSNLSELKNIMETIWFSEKSLPLTNYSTLGFELPKELERKTRLELASLIRLSLIMPFPAELQKK